MPRVLIPSENRDFAWYLAEAYHRAGWEAAVGAGNFELSVGSYDLVHLQWPEELSDWRPPSERQLEAIVHRVERWAGSAKLVMTVHNLEPHREGKHPQYQRLYSEFYSRVPVFAHFTESSREAALGRYPESRDAKHIVTGYFNMDHLVPKERDPAAARRLLGFRDDEFVLLAMGGLREWDEVNLLRHAFDRADIHGKRLLMCARYDEAGPAWQQRWRRWNFRHWLSRRCAVVQQQFIPDSEMYRFVDAADALVIPRFRSLNSGLPAIGASFGKIVIAPECGAYPELLSGTQNPNYAPGDAVALASAIERASRLDRPAVAAENARLARAWSWDAIVERILAEI